MRWLWPGYQGWEMWLRGLGWKRGADFDRRTGDPERDCSRTIHLCRNAVGAWLEPTRTINVHQTQHRRCGIDRHRLTTTTGS
eukprot:COSAG02_NODE_35390_length_469_cov_0.745946_1_plen_81_part_10